jgi:hypothetical protein
MGSVIYSMGVSLDGFIAGPDGAIDWAAPDEELMRFTASRLASSARTSAAGGCTRTCCPGDRWGAQVGPQRARIRPDLEGWSRRGRSAPALSISATGDGEAGPSRPPVNDGGPALGTVPARARPPPRV